MMSTTVLKPATTPIPVQLSENEFTAFILPHLWLSRRIGEINGAILSILLDRAFMFGTAKCKALDRQGLVSAQ